VYTAQSKITTSLTKALFLAGTCESHQGLLTFSFSKESLFQIEANLKNKGKRIFSFENEKWLINLHPEVVGVREGRQ